MRLMVVRQPFDHPDFLFELKWDGWRCLAHVGAEVRLYSRHGHPYKRFDVVRRDSQGTATLSRTRWRDRLQWVATAGHFAGV